MANNKKCLKNLKMLRKRVNWEVEDERREFIHVIYPLIKNWKGLLPNLRNVFRKEEIDRLLMDSAIKVSDDVSKFEEAEQFVSFAAGSGYKDEPRLDQDGKPFLHRTTPLHWAARSEFDLGRLMVLEFFKIYDRFDANCTDESGLTHFHVACQYDCEDEVKKFLELGQDPNLLVPETGDSPLHVAVDHACSFVIEVLLKSGADPNSINKKGFTPLHKMCMNSFVYEFDEFFQLNDELQQPLQLDARDKLGRTPLQWAVANLHFEAFDKLLDHGADLSSFNFPSESHFDDCFEILEERTDKQWFTLTSDLPIMIKQLEKRGYEFDRSDVSTIMKICVKHKLLVNSANLDERLRSNEEFVNWAKEKFLVRCGISLNDLMQLRPKEAEKHIIHWDQNEYGRTFLHWPMAEWSSVKTCVQRLLELMMTRFFRRWALDSFLELTRYRLPILCCEMVIEKLMIEDLCHVCLTAED